MDVMVVVVSLNHVDRGWPNKSANLCPDPSQPQPFPSNSPKTARMTGPLTLTSISSTIHPFISVVLSTAQKTPLTQAVILKSCVSQSVLSPPPTNTHRSGAKRRPQDIVIPDSYPFQPVKMKFITKVYHP